MELEDPDAPPRSRSITAAYLLLLSTRVAQASPLYCHAVALAWLTLLTFLRIFLIAKGRDDEARALLIKHHAAGDVNSVLVQHEVAQIRESVRTENNSEKRPTLKKMLASPANRRRLLISAMVGIAAQWSGNTVVSYYLVLVLDGVGITNATHQSLINGGLQIFNLLATVGCGAMLVDTLGRRRLFQWCAVGMTVSYVVRNYLS